MIIPAQVEFLSPNRVKVTGASFFPSAMSVPLTVISVIEDIYSGSVFVLSEAATRMTVPGAMVRVTPAGIRISWSILTSPDHVVSDVSTVQSADAGSSKRTRNKVNVPYLFRKDLLLKRPRDGIPEQDCSVFFISPLLAADAS
jgi:hypothetical protein